MLKLMPRDGDVRSIRKFAWLPTFIDNYHKKVWLGYYYVIQIYHNCDDSVCGADIYCKIPQWRSLDKVSREVALHFEDVMADMQMKHEEKMAELEEIHILNMMENQCR